MILRKRFSYLYFPETGSILIICMWVLVFFSVLSAGLYNAVSSWIKISKVMEQRAVGYYLAKAACIYIQSERKLDTDSYDTLYELREKKEKEINRGKFTYILIDEDSKININTASAEILSRLPSMTKDLAKAVNESVLKPFNLKEEILLVDGINKEIFDSCKDFITVNSGGGVNINTAPGEVLSALGLDEQIVSSIKTFRAGDDKEEATKDDKIFENAGDVISKLRGVMSFSEAQEAAMLQLISSGLIITASNYFSIQLDTYIMNRLAVKYDIIFGAGVIRQWREY